MKKAEFIDEVLRSAGMWLHGKDAEKVVDAVFSTVGKAVHEAGRFAWRGFGTFEIRERAERQGRNPRTGETRVIGANRTVGFKPARALRRSL